MIQSEHMANRKSIQTKICRSLRLTLFACTLVCDFWQPEMLNATQLHMRYRSNVHPRNGGCHKKKLRHQGVIAKKPLSQCGLINPGSCCFMNSIIQLLSENTLLLEYISLVKDNGHNPVTMTLKSIFRKMAEKKSDISVEHLALYNLLFMTKYRSAKNIPQEDSNSLYIAISNALGEEYVVNVRSKNIEQCRKVFYNKYGLGIYVTTMDYRKRPEDSKYEIAKTSTEKMASLIVSYNENGLQKSLDNYFAPHYEQFLSNDEGLLDRKEKYVVDNMPSHLTLHINYTNTNDNIMIEKTVNINGREYEVKSFVVRSTARSNEGILADSGHYYTISRHGKRWYRFDDQSVRSVGTVDDVYNELLPMEDDWLLPAQQICTIYLVSKD